MRTLPPPDARDHGTPDRRAPDRRDGDPARARPGSDTRRADGGRFARRPVDDGPGPLELLKLLAIGAAVGVAVTALLPGNFSWLLCALPHEMGHATIGCVLGLPSTPAISLHGHAWTGHGAFRPWLPFAVALALGGFALALRRQRPVLAIGLGVAAIVIPACAFSRIGEVLTIAGGHTGELLFAGYCYALVTSGGRTGSAAERAAGAAAGAIVQFANLKLTLGLMTSSAARAVYATNGSLGLKNDYLRLAQDVLGCRLETVAALMLLLSLLPLPLGLLGGHLARRRA